MSRGSRKLTDFKQGTFLKKIAVVTYEFYQNGEE